MKQFFLLGTAAAVLAASPALAQSRSYRAAPVAPLAVFNWTGCYVGLHAGGGLMHDSFTSSDSEGQTQSGNGAVAGGQAGCNYQTGFFVAGLEGEGYWSGFKSTSGYSSSTSLYSSTYETRNKYDFSLAARMGFAYDRMFVYGKAGWVWGRFDMLETGVSCCNYNNGGSNYYNFTTSGTAGLNGLLLGIGLEYALTQNWTVKGEYNYLNYGSKSTTYLRVGDNEGAYTYTRSQGADKQIFKLGFNYLFHNGMVPPP